MKELRSQKKFVALQKRIAEEMLKPYDGKPLTFLHDDKITFLPIKRIKLIWSFVKEAREKEADIDANIASLKSNQSGRSGGAQLA